MEENNYTKKQKFQIAGKITAMALVVILLVCFLCDVFNYPNSALYVKRYHTYNNLKENTVDAVYIGASVVDRSWASPIAFNEYGMTVFPFSSDSAPCVLIKNMMIEANKTQSPKLWIIDVKSFIIDPAKEGQAERVRRVTDLWPISLNKIKTLNYAFKYLKQNDNFKFEPSWYIPFIKYHNRWESQDGVVERLSYSDFINAQDKYMGAYASGENSGTALPVNRPKTTEEISKIPANSEEVLRDLLDYIKEKNEQVLFVISPCADNIERFKKFNHIFSIIDEYGFDYINFNTEEMYKTLDIDFNTDFYDEVHFNIKGSLKYTDYFAEYLHNNYDFPDHRNDENYNDWHEAYNNYEVFSQKYLKKIK